MPAMLFVPCQAVEFLPNEIMIEDVAGVGAPVLQKSIVEIEFEGIGSAEKDVHSSVTQGMTFRFSMAEENADRWMLVASESAREGAIRTVMIRKTGNSYQKVRVWIRRVLVNAL